MAVPFEKFKALYPPHPAVTWNPEQVHRLSGYVTQFKYDDWRILIYFYPDGSIRFFSRKKAPLPRYRPPASLLASLKSLELEPGKFHVLDGGLMHYKTQRVKNTVVLWDVLVHDSQHLVGATYGHRYELLKKIAHEPKEWVKLSGVPVALKIAPQLWLAPILKGDPKASFELAVPLEEIEGLVLKNLKAPLTRASTQEANARWQVRVRKPRIDYRF